ncbi:MAG TPA: radical SAM protein [Oscillospiraceae bacterium]|nr:radical SAM protein [Oscillospiraceae bacterium]HPF54947.1 radical SAM protein [Clostridiales bacterium]HPK35006.1 radical SAM protein [Oscillospiraceae bacterium]HPR75564.1 radical SAM protein [Oscillospiraceae bacterium]
MSQLLEALASKEELEKSIAFEQYLRKSAFEKGVPLIGYFELTPRCTLNCVMCYVHLNPVQMSNQAELPVGQWKSLMDQACDAGMLYAVLTGGECLMYPGFFELYEHLQSRGVLISVFTNATLIDEKTVLWLSKHPPQRVQISVYGSSAEQYQTITGSADAFDKVDHAIDLLKAANIPLNLAITVCRQMLSDFEPLLRYCKSKAPVPYYINPFPFPARSETGRAYGNYTPSTDEIVEIFKTRKRFEGGSAIPWSCEEELLANATHAENADEPPFSRKVSCTAGTIKFSINWRGVMTPCNVFDFAESHPLKDGFRAAWDEIHTKTAAYRTPVECTKCAYRRACIPCPAIHWLASGKDRVNPLICTTIKKLSLEGLRTL